MTPSRAAWHSLWPASRPRLATPCPTADHQIVSPSYFATLDVPILEGRGFSDRDAEGAPPVCIVNEAIARRLFGGRSPLGRQIALRPQDAAVNEAVTREIIGVARQVNARPDDTEASLQIYVPLAQVPTDDLYLFVRPSTADAAELTHVVRSAIGRVDTDQLVSVRNMRTLDAIAAGATSQHRFRAVVVGAFAALALLLAMVGVFGQLTSFVQGQSRELAVRRAIGATTGAILRLVVVGSAGVVATGAAIGFVLAAVLGRPLAPMLFGVPAHDVPTFAGAAVALVVATIASIAAPAWRATRIDPVTALRGR